MDGDLKAVRVGVFPKLMLEFGYLTEAELKAILALLEPATLSVTWWDTQAEDYDTANFYAGDLEYPYWSKSKGMYAPFSVNLIPYSKKT